MKHPIPSITYDSEKTKITARLVTFGILLLFCAITAIIYANTLNSPFLFDDQVFIVRDFAIRMNEFKWDAIKTAALEGRPKHRYLANISFAVNYYFGQYHPTGYHLTNILIHMVCAFFLYLFIRDTLTRTPAGRTALPADIPPWATACFATLLWLVHPVHTGAVTYISQRMTSLAALFFILSLWFYALARREWQTRRLSCRSLLLFAGSALAGICALSTKENAGTLPLIILLYEWFFFQDLKLVFNRRFVFWIIGATFIFGAIALHFLGVDPAARILNAYASREFTLVERVMTEWRVLIYYLSLLVWPSPSRLTLDHNYPLSTGLFNPLATGLCLAALLCLTGTAMYTSRRNRLFSFCIFWFFINLIIESSVIGIEIIYEHRTYLPFMMCCLFALIPIFKTTSKPQFSIAAILLVIMLFSAWTFQRNRIWHDPITFWEDSVKKAPNDYRPYFNLGIAYSKAGMPEKAIRQFENVLPLWDFKNVLQKKSVYPDTLCNIGNALLETGYPEKAMDYYLKAIAALPQHMEARNNLAKALIEQNRVQEALVHLNYILDRNPTSEVYINTGSALARLNRIDDAITCYKKALDMDPASPEAYNNLGVMMLHKQNYAAAVNYFKSAIKVKPDYASALANLQRLESLLNSKPATVLRW